MIVSFKIYPTLIDVFYGKEGFKKQEWMRCAWSKDKQDWFVTEWPAMDNMAEHEYGCVQAPVEMLEEIYQHLEEKYGPR